MVRAADRLVDCLKAEGVDRLFCVPGESYLALLDALRFRDGIDTVACRHEGGAGFMAVADAKLTGRPGCLAVSRGPGATNASIAIHLAEQDAVPLVVLVGQVARIERGRGAFQEVDYGKTFADLAKAVWEVQDADRLPEIVARAFHVARTPTPGPVVVVLPEDLLTEETEAPVVRPAPAPLLMADVAAIEEIGRLLAGAERPLLIAGGALDSPDGRRALKAAAEAHHVPVALSFKRQELFDNAHPLFAGHLGFKIPRRQVAALAEADLILAVGTRLGDVTTQGYSLVEAPEPRQPLVHVYPDAARIGRVHRTTLGLVADPVATLVALVGRASNVNAARHAWAERVHGVAAELAHYEPRAFADGVDFGHVVAPLARLAPRDSIVVMDSGNFAGWVHRLWRWDGTQRALGAVGGAMGLGVPGAVAASLRHPDRTVLAFVGDGGLMMTGNELATAVATGAAPKIFVSNNRSYGTIRLHQERAFPGRPSATDLVNPDFATWARAFGVEGITVATPEEAEPAVRRALAAAGPVVVDVRASLEAVSAYTTIGKLRAGA